MVSDKEKKVRVDTTISYNLLSEIDIWNKANPTEKIRITDALARGARSFLDEKTLDDYNILDNLDSKKYIPIKIRDRIKLMRNSLKFLNEKVKELESKNALGESK